MGPNRCALCISDEETVAHLFHLCPYAESVWKEACSELKYQGNPGNYLEHKASTWWTDKSICQYSALPSLFCYGIWWAGNIVIFNNKLIPTEVTSTLVIQWVKEHRSQEKYKKNGIMIPLEINKSIPWAFFDGASQGDPPLGGSGGVVYFSANHKIHAKYSPGHYTNNKDKLGALHLFLNVAINNNISQLQFFGDSKMLVDWVNMKIQINAPNLQ